MSILRTLTFPGDNEPREIQDNRIEILNYDSVNGILPLTYQEIYDKIDSGKIVQINYNGQLYQLDLIHTRDKITQGLDCLIFSSNSIVEANDINDNPPCIYINYFQINNDNTIVIGNIDYPLLDRPSDEEIDKILSVGANKEFKWIKVPTGIRIDNTLTISEAAADAQAVGNKISSLPITIAEDGYTDIVGLRQATQIDVEKADNIISILTTLEGDNTPQHLSTIKLDENNFPITITTNDIICNINWKGF